MSRSTTHMTRRSLLPVSTHIPRRTVPAKRLWGSDEVTSSSSSSEAEDDEAWSGSACLVMEQSWTGIKGKSSVKRTRIPKSGSGRSRSSGKVGERERRAGGLEEKAVIDGSGEEEGKKKKAKTGVVEVPNRRTRSRGTNRPTLRAKSMSTPKSKPREEVEEVMTSKQVRKKRSSVKVKAQPIASSPPSSSEEEGGGKEESPDPIDLLHHPDFEYLNTHPGLPNIVPDHRNNSTFEERGDDSPRNANVITEVRGDKSLTARLRALLATPSIRTPARTIRSHVKDTPREKKRVRIDESLNTTKLIFSIPNTSAPGPVSHAHMPTGTPIQRQSGGQGEGLPNAIRALRYDSSDLGRASVTTAKRLGMPGHASPTESSILDYQVSSDSDSEHGHDHGDDLDDPMGSSSTPGHLACADAVSVDELKDPGDERMEVDNSLSPGDMSRSGSRGSLRMVLQAMLLPETQVVDPRITPSVPAPADISSTESASGSVGEGKMGISPSQKMVANGIKMPTDQPPKPDSGSQDVADILRNPPLGGVASAEVVSISPERWLDFVDICSTAYPLPCPASGPDPQTPECQPTTTTPTLSEHGISPISITPLTPDRIDRHDDVQVTTYLPRYPTPSPPSQDPQSYGPWSILAQPAYQIPRPPHLPRPNLAIPNLPRLDVVVRPSWDLVQAQHRAREQQHLDRARANLNTLITDYITRQGDSNSRRPNFRQ